MTRDELAKKEVIKIKDIQNAYGLSYDTACKIIRAVKAYSDRLNIRGVVHQLDYQEFMKAKTKYEESFS